MQLSNISVVRSYYKMNAINGGRFVLKKRRRFTVFAIAILLLPGITCAAGQPKETLNADEYNILKICEGVVRLFQNHPKDIWPGYNLSQRPFIVYVPEKWILLFNCSQGIEDFGPYPEDWPDLGTHVLYHQGTYKNLVGQLAFNFEVDSLTTYAVGLPEKFPESFDNPELKVFGYIAHEGFHQYQREAFGEIPWAREERYPILDVENSALAYLEMVILIDALEAMKTDDRDRCHKLLKLFVAVRNHRWNGADPFVAKYEQGQEINEGTAQYVELKSIDLMTDLKYESSLEGLTRPLKDSFRSISMPEALISDFHDRMREGFVPPEDMLRNRIYPVGSAQGFLLDYFEIDWKGRAQQAGSTFMYSDLFQERLGINESEFEMLLDEAKQAYDYDDILAATSRSIGEYLASYQEELATFQGQTGYRIEVDFFYTSISRSRLSKAKKWVVDKGTWTLCNHFNVYTLENNDLTLQLHNTGVLERNDWDKKRKTVVFYVTKLDSLLLDEKAAPVKEKFEHTFETIELQGVDLKLSVQKAGTITSTNGDIKITLAR